MTHEEMILAYKQLSAAATYIIGFAMKHKIYFTQRPYPEAYDYPSTALATF